jgi:hypothetical protein
MSKDSMENFEAHRLAMELEDRVVKCNRIITCLTATITTLKQKIAK